MVAVWLQAKTAEADAALVVFGRHVSRVLSTGSVLNNVTDTTTHVLSNVATTSSNVLYNVTDTTTRHVLSSVADITGQTPHWTMQLWSVALCCYNAPQIPCACKGRVCVEGEKPLLFARRTRATHVSSVCLPAST
jgi:hypothetical protein